MPPVAEGWSVPLTYVMPSPLVSVSFALSITCAVNPTIVPTSATMSKKSTATAFAKRFTIFLLSWYSSAARANSAVPTVPSPSTSNTCNVFWRSCGRDFKAIHPSSFAFFAAAYISKTSVNSSVSKLPFPSGPSISLSKGCKLSGNVVIGMEKASFARLPNEDMVMVAWCDRVSRQGIL